MIIEVDFSQEINDIQKSYVDTISKFKRFR